MQPDRTITPALKQDPALWVMTHLVEEIAYKGEAETLADIAGYVRGQDWAMAMAVAHGLETLRSIQGVSLSYYTKTDAMPLREQLDQLMAMAMGIRKRYVAAEQLRGEKEAERE